MDNKQFDKTGKEQRLEDIKDIPLFVNLMRNNLLPKALMPFGILHPDFTEKQLEVVEQIINHEYPVGHKPQATTIAVVGFFLGECVIRNIPGAEWDTNSIKSAEHVLSMTIKITGGGGGLSGVSGGPAGISQMYPFNRVSKYWANRDDKLTTWLRTSQLVNEVNFKKTYHEKRVLKDGWIGMNNGDMYRMFMGDKTGKDMKGIGHSHTMPINKNITDLLDGGKEEE